MLDKTKLDGPLASFRIDIGCALSGLVTSSDMSEYDMLILSMYMRGMTIADIAAVLSRSKNAIMSRLKEVFRKVAEKLGDDYLE